MKSQSLILACTLVMMSHASPALAEPPDAAPARPDLPSPAAAPKPVRRSTAALVTGIVTTASAGPLFFSGLGLMLSGTAMACPGGCPLTAANKLGIGLMVGSAASLAVGIPLIVFGNQKIDGDAHTTAARQPVLLLGPASGALRVAF